MSITLAREAINRYNTNVATAQQEEFKKRIQNLKNLRAICPTTEIIEITCSNEMITMIRTVEKLKLFNGSLQKEDP